jgi:hypothetical protein
MKIISLFFLIFSFSVLATMPNRVNIITPEFAACNGFSINYKDRTTLYLVYPKVIKDNLKASSVTIDYLVKGEVTFTSRVSFSELYDKPYVFLGFSDGFKLDHDALIDFSYSCIDCDNAKSGFYRIESIKNFSESFEDNPSEILCDRSS